MSGFKTILPALISISRIRNNHGEPGLGCGEASEQYFDFGHITDELTKLSEQAHCHRE